MRYCTLISILFFLMSTPQASAQRKMTLTQKTYPAILKTLQNPPVKTHWNEIPWHTSFTEAIGVAREEDKPVLLWIMNGHPCGMT